MKRKCPVLTCKSPRINRDGVYRRKDDSRFIQRFRCKECGKRFSSATTTLEYRQKKRRINYSLYKLFCSGMSQRRAARTLGVHHKTIARKLRYLGEKMRGKQKRLLERLEVEELQFDDLITSHHTKLKPLTVPVLIDSRKRLILTTEVAPIPAFGYLAKKSVKKYGRRKCEHRDALKQCFERIKHLSPRSIKSDKHHFYKSRIEECFPQAKYQQYESRPATVVGMGEMKKGGFDPLFSINHTLAMLRANINRLFRRTWNTTKDPRRLKDHLDLYTWYHNQMILEANTT